MTRKRMIDPGIWQSEQVGTLPPEGRLLFMGMFSNADDEGRLKASAAYLKAIIFPYDENLSLKRVEELKHQIAVHSLIVLYRAAEQEYLWLPTWDRYQKIKTPSPSQLPPPPTERPEPSPTSTRSQEGTPPQQPDAGMVGPSDHSADDREASQRETSGDAETLPKGFRNERLLQHFPSDGEKPTKRDGIGGEGLPQDLSNVGEALPKPFAGNGDGEERREGLPNRFGNDGETLPKGFGNVSETFPPRLEEVSRGKDSRSKEKLGECRLVEGKGSGETIPGPGQPPADGLQPPASSDSDTDNTLQEASQGERRCLKLLRSLPHWPFDFQRDLTYLRQLYVEFPRVDMLREVTDFATHAMDKPIKNRGSPRLRLRHWIEKGAQFAEERRQQGERGRETARGLSQPGRSPETAPRQIIQPIESGPDEGIAGVAGRGRVGPVQPADTN